MPAIDDLRVLSGIPLFAGIEGPDLQRIAGLLRRRTFPAGSSIITTDQPGEVAYVILEGTVKIFIEKADGTEVVLAFLASGDTVGEMSLVDSSGRSADVVAVERCSTLWLDRQAFHALLRSVPQLAYNLFKVLTGRLRLANEQLQAVTTLDVTGRVARQILAFADRYGRPIEGGTLVPLRLAQGDLAGLVGASRERVNRAVVSLKRSGAIEVDRRHRVTVRDREALRSLCT
jgi:CRP-like cAMP-binding protein